MHNSVLACCMGASLDPALSGEVGPRVHLLSSSFVTK
jgi:hypothetical protein